MSPKRAMAMSDEQAYNLLRDLVNEWLARQSGHKHEDGCSCLADAMYRDLEPIRCAVLDMTSDGSMSATEAVDDLSKTYCDDLGRRLGDDSFRARMIIRFKAQRELFRRELAETN